MTKPPDPPRGGAEPGGEQPGWRGWDPAHADDEPTQQMGPRGGGQRDQTQQVPQPPYGQQPGQYGPPGPYGQPPYNPPGQYGQPGQYGRPGPYGQQPYGQYGPPGQQWAPPGMPGGHRPASNKNTVIALVVAGVVVLAAVGAALWLLFLRSTGDSTVAPPSTSESPAIPPATVDPEGLGEDPVMNRYARDCYDGDMEACDTLFRVSERDTEYETYGGTCAGRQAIDDARTVYCTDAFPTG
jgi:hypothetical protein